MEKTYPLLQSQLGIFIECQAEPTLTRYNLGARLFLTKNIDLDRLEQAVKRVVAARPMLRTRFIINEEGEPRQYEDPDMEIAVARHHMSEKELDAYIQEQFMRPFQLVGTEPLCRFDIVETENRRYLLYCLHHAIAMALPSSRFSRSMTCPKLMRGIR